MQKYKRYADTGMNRAVSQLVEYRQLLKEAERMTARVEEYRKKCFDLKAQRFDLERISGGRKTNIGDLIIKYSDMEMDARVKLQEMERLMFQIECRLWKLSTEERTVLEAYYLNGKSVDKIAEAQGYSRSVIIRKKEQALGKFAKMI